MDEPEENVNFCDAKCLDTWQTSHDFQLQKKKLDRMHIQLHHGCFLGFQDVSDDR